MLGFKILEIIMNISFVFAITTYFLPCSTLVENSNALFNYMLMYIWTVFVTYIGCKLKEQKKFYFLVIFLMLPIPLFYKNEGSIIFTILTSIAMGFYLYKYKDLSSSSSIKVNFKRGIGVFTAIIALSLVTMTYSFINRVSGFFMVIYFMTGVILIRSLRHLEHNKDMGKINKQNMKYLVFIIVFSLILSTEKVLNGILHGLKITYDFLVDMIFKLFYWVFIAAGYMAMFLIKIFQKLLRNGKFEMREQKPPEETLEEFMKTNQGEISPVFLAIIDWIFKILFMALILYIIWRVFKRNMSKNIIEEEYTEEREYIGEKKKSKKKKSIFRPKNEKEAIRYYYRKFLNKCLKDDIAVESHDTTKEINKKAKIYYAHESLENLRNTYIDVRYGEVEVSKDIVKEFKENYKKI